MRNVRLLWKLVFVSAIGGGLLAVAVSPVLGQAEPAKDASAPPAPKPQTPSAVPSSPAPAAAPMPAAGNPAAPEAAKDSAAPESEDRFGGTVGEMSAAQALAELDRKRRRHERGRPERLIRNLQSYEYDLTGKDENVLMQEAIVRALKSTAARLYFDEKIILGRDLLEPYLKVYADRFVAHREIVSRRVAAGGERTLRIKVGIDVDRLYSDLEEKHFVSQPKLRPIVGVLLKEVLGGQPTGNSRGRALLEDALKKKELRVESSKMPAALLASNGASDEQALQNALEEAQRWDVDVIVTGSLDIIPREDQVILYDQVFFTQGKIALSLIRVDNGEVLRTVTDRQSAWGLSAEESLKSLLDALLVPAAAKLADGFLVDWSNMMLDKSDYRLMIKGVTPELLTSIQRMIETISPTIQLYVKSFYGDVAVLNVKYPNARPGQFEQFLKKSKVPQFRVQPSDERHIIIDVL